MKVTFDIECTPEEARRFLGLPDVVPLQDVAMKEIQKKLEQTIRSMDAETLARTWMPMAMQGWQDLQKTFWGQMSAASPAGGMAGMGWPRSQPFSHEPRSAPESKTESAKPHKKAAKATKRRAR